MRYYKKITVLAALAVAAVGQMFAQNQSSPYSRYGYGLFSDYATSAQRNMGGVGVAMADGRQINVMNPASYAATDSLTLHWDIGLDLTQLKSSEEGNSGKAFGGGLNYLTLQFPITKYMGASIGLVPYTTVGYSFGNNLKDDDGTVQTSQSTSVSGYGGIDELYVGLGARPVRGLTLGANFSYQFGTIVNDQYVISSTSTLYEQKIQVRDWNVLLGLQYTQRLAPKHQLTFGFTYSPKKDFHGRTWGVKYDMSGDVSSTSGAAKPDTIANERLQTMGYSKPNAYAFGLNYNFDQRLSALKSVNDVKADEQILDIGDASAQELAEILKNAKTILWNGPVGVFEFPNFRKGTEIVANAIADSEAFSIAGGGDTLAAIDLFGIADKISYISTGGGAFLEFVEGKVLPAVAMLEERAKK